MICDGGDGSGNSTGSQTFDTTKYAELYAFLGSNKVPDLRECNLVGIGKNRSFTIGNHDEYTLGQFRDDRIQNITGRVSVMCSQHVGAGDFQDGAFSKDDTYINQADDRSGKFMAKLISFNASRVVRTGDVTHGKQIGVNYLIKAL